MSYGYDGSLAGKGVYRALYLLFRLHVHRRGGFIQNDYRRMTKDGSRNGYTLLLSSRETQAALADHCVIPLGHGVDLGTYVRGLGSFLYFFSGCVGSGIADILPYCSVKQECILHNCGNILPKALNSHVAYILPVYSDTALVRLVKTGNQLSDRGFAHTGGPH